MRKRITHYASILLVMLTIISGCKKDGEEVSPAAFSINELEMDFGTVEVGETNSFTFEVTNIGGEALQINSISISGTDASAFATDASAEVVEEGEVYAFTVSFMPSSEGAKSANLDVVTNVGEESIALLGEATPELVAGISLSDEKLVFGQVFVGNSSDLSLTITSTGNANLEISSIAFEGDDAAEFSAILDPFTLNAGTDTTVNITFAPQVAGEKNASIILTTNAGEQSVSLTATAADQPTAELTVNTSTLVFGEVDKSENKDLTFDISNTGTADLQVNGLTITGAASGDYEVVSPSSAFTVVPDASQTVTIRFTPSEQGSRAAILTVTSNVEEVTVDLSGEGIASPEPSVSFSESPVAFGNVGVGQESSKNITISNTGDADLEITNVNLIGGSGVSSFSIVGGTSSLVRTITPGDSHTFEIKFNPSSAGFVSGSIRFINNSSNETIYLPMNGTGVTPAIAFTETGLNFGDVTVGNTGTDLTFEVQNNGSGALEISNIRLTNSTDFSLVNVSAPQTVAPNGSYVITVRFSPQSEGQKNTMVVVESNDPTKPSYALIANGVGKAPVTGNVVNIPDANFKAALVSDVLINTNGDSEIQVSEAQAYTGVIRVDGENIANVTGLEEFVNITGFHAMNNSLTSIDLSQNTAITRLSLTSNSLTALDLSQNTALQTILIQNNNITSLDLTNHSDLGNLQCGNNAISTLSLPATANSLRTLYLEVNEISSIDVSNYPDLRTLVVYNNDLTSIDISSNPKVNGLHARANNLSSLNVANGNNANFIYMVADGNSNLTCVQHDAGFDPLNPTNTQANQWTKPTAASWSTTPCQ